MRQLPDWLRKALGLEPRFRKGSQRLVPFAVEAALNDVLERMVAGPNRNLQTAGVVKTNRLLEVAHSLQKTWHQLHAKHCEKTGEEPLAFKQDDVNSKWISRFLAKWGWSIQSSNTKGAYLADDSELMNETGVRMIKITVLSYSILNSRYYPGISSIWIVLHYRRSLQTNLRGIWATLNCQEIRKSHRAQREITETPWTLVLNYDQMWRSGYEPPKTVLHKKGAANSAAVGEIRPDYLKGKRLETVMEIVQNEMSKKMADAPPSKLRKTAARTEMVQGGRFGVTAVTSCWGSGEVGPLGVCIPSGSVPLSFLRDFNSEWHGHVYIFESGSESHFMSSDTTILYLQNLISPAPKPLYQFCVVILLSPHLHNLIVYVSSGASNSRYTKQVSSIWTQPLDFV